MLPQTYVQFNTQDEPLQRLYDTAVRKCLNNLNTFSGDQVLVEGGGYEKIWLETQPMGGEMYAKHNMTAAMNNQLLFMRHQRADGRLAGSIQGFPDGTVEAQFNKFQGFCFPWPALNMYYWLRPSSDTEPGAGYTRAMQALPLVSQTSPGLRPQDPASMYLDQLADCLERFDAYLWRVRDSNGDGILESWCVYDTGEDNAVRYGDAPNYATEEVPPEGSTVVPMASMDVMSFSYAARDALCEISRIRNDGREAEWRKAADEVAAVIREQLWDDERGACFDKDKHGNVIDVLCHNTLRCMYWGSLSQEMADRFVKEHLLNPDEFWTHLPLPSVAVNDPAFRNAPENNWSGQCEGLTYQRAILALERYGYEKLVPVLGKKLFKAVIDGGYVFTQQFDPFTGMPSCVSSVTKEPLPPDPDGSEVGQCPTNGSDCLHISPRSPRQPSCPGRAEIQDSYGPTLLSVLEYIAHIWGVTMVRGRIWFSLGSGAPYSYEQGWGKHVYRIESNGKTARVFVDGIEKFRSECGIRLITDAEGNLLSKTEIE